MICTLDESRSIAGVLAETQIALADLSYEIIVVDDSADDRTAAVVRSLISRDPRIRLLKRQGVRGLASACIAGWDIARGDILGVMDGDGQHDASLIAGMVDKLQAEQADIAVASRFRPDTQLGLSGFRRLLSTAGVGLSRLVIGAHTTDPLAGFFLQTRAWFEQARAGMSGVGFKILVDVLASGQRAPKVVEVSTSLRARIGGESKLDLRIMFELAAQLVEKRTGNLIPSRFIMFASVGVTGLVVHMAALALLRHLEVTPFWVAQALATATAMASNFTLNNLLTFRDLRLTGRAWWGGLARFAMACASGALIAEFIALTALQMQTSWLLAGGMGAAGAAIWNYWSSSRAAWGVPAQRRDAAAGVVVVQPGRP
ncbi:glycosyltransferase [Bosea sp. OK403]|uniref:glycosyltransferase n=1 Tax=Bosea sp. OK403 TaxID=1855286 RepID=UPI0015870AB6|nr:glycosyltransferase [Bosea sp. OK403]